jgi:hypothetical protein
VAGTGGAQERGAAWRRMQRAATPLWAACVPTCDQRTVGDVSRCVRRPRQECTAGSGAEPTGGPRSATRPARGRTSRRPRSARRPGERRGLGPRPVGSNAEGAALARDGAARRRPARDYVAVPCFERVKLKKLWRSAPTDE